MRKPLHLLLIVFQLIGFSAFAQTTIVLQPDAAAGKDAEIFSCVPCGYDTRNFGNKRDLNAITWTNGGNLSKIRSLFQFDLSTIPNGAIISDARLTLFFNPTSQEGTHFSSFPHDNSAVLKRIITPWAESTVTWNTKPTTTGHNAVVLPHTTSSNQNYIDINVKNLVVDMINNPNTSFGFLLKLKKEYKFNKLIFASSDNADASLHPKLVITYTVLATTEINEDGASELRTPQNILQNAISLAPNPAKDEVKLMIISQEENISELHVYNAIGKEVYSQKQAVSKGDNIFILPCNTWGKGIYYFLVKTSGGVVTKKLIVE